MPRPRDRVGGDELGRGGVDPLGITDMAFTRTDDMQQRTVAMHARGADGSLTPMDDFALPDNPEVDMAGHGLYGSVGEYMKFIRMWLNDGMGPNGPVLKPETVEDAVKNGLQSPSTGRHAARRDPIPVQRRRVLPRPQVPTSFAHVRVNSPQGTRRREWQIKASDAI